MAVPRIERRHRAADRRELTQIMGYFAVVKKEDAAGSSITHKFRLHNCLDVRLMISTLIPLVRSIPKVIVVDFGKEQFEVWRL